MRGRHNAIAAVLLSLMWPSLALAQRPSQRMIYTAMEAAAASGTVMPLGASFAVRGVDGDAYEISIELPSGNTIHSLVDYSANSATLRLEGPDGQIAALGADDLRAIEIMRSAQADDPPARTGRHLDVFARVADWVAEASPGYRPDIKADLAAWESLCRRLGRKTLINYDTFFGDVTDRVSIGKCFDSDGLGCPGRCGAGCEDDLPSWREQVQVFTKDCLIHDVCVGELGIAAESCHDEFTDTFDDALNAPDCNGVEGSWKLTYKTNKYSAAHTFTITDPTSIRSVSSGGDIFAGTTRDPDGPHTISGERIGDAYLVAISLPIVWHSSCANGGEYSRQATASFLGTSSCGKVRAKLHNGKWGQAEWLDEPGGLCVLGGRSKWRGKVTFKRLNSARESGARSPADAATVAPKQRENE